jgi:Plasmid pRiA4b ORF-3-like protein
MDIYQLKITLQDVRPAIWRRVQVPGTLTLAALHYVVQIVFGWTDSHLHGFCVGEHRYGLPREMDEDLRDESRVTLDEVVGRHTKRFRYVYDYGDDWFHDVKVEKVLAGNTASPEMTCMDGHRNCPPEDCGGPGGYYEFLQAIGDPDHPDHDEMLDWIGGAFDPEAFDLGAVNRALAEFGSLFRSQRKRARGAAR